MNEEQQYHVRRGLEAFIGGEAHPTIEMVAEEGARLAAHELGLDAPPVHLVRHEKSERISPFQSSLLVPIFLLYSAETWTKEVRMYNFGRLIEIPSTVFRNLNKNQIDRQLTQFKLKLDLRKLFGTRFYRRSKQLQEKVDSIRELKIISKTYCIWTLVIVSIMAAPMPYIHFLVVSIAKLSVLQMLRWNRSKLSHCTTTSTMTS